MELLKKSIKKVEKPGGMLFVNSNATVDISDLDCGNIASKQVALSRRDGNLTPEAKPLVETWYHIFKIAINNGVSIISRGIRTEGFETYFKSVGDFEEFEEFEKLRKSGFNAPEPFGVFIASDCFERRLFVENVPHLNAIEEIGRLEGIKKMGNINKISLWFEYLKEDLYKKGFNVNFEFTISQVGLEREYPAAFNPRQAFVVLDAESFVLKYKD